MARDYVERAEWPDVAQAIVDFKAGRPVKHCQAIKRYLVLPDAGPGQTALDACCGSGQGAAILASKGYQVEALDKDPAAAALLQRHNIPFFHARLEGWRPLRKYDLIVLSDALEHLDDPASILGRLRGWLERDGQLYLTVPLEGRSSPNPFHLHAWTRAGLVRLISRHWIIKREFAPTVNASFWAMVTPRPHRVATLSFDDGGWQDRFVVNALNEEGVSATFYLPAGFCDRAHYHVDRGAMVQMYDGHEIGCHSMSHPDFRHLPPKKLVVQTQKAREHLQALFAQEVVGFAWPYGAVELSACEALQRAGFLYARSMRTSQREVDTPRERWDVAITSRIPPCGSPVNLVRFQSIHLVGHSWRIRDERRVPAMRAAIGLLKQSGFAFVTNGEFLGGKLSNG